MEEKQISVTVGALIRRHLREMIVGEIFAGSPIRWMENKRLIESTFHIRGPVEHVNNIEQRIDYWIKAMG